jgi:hypothetical protein
MVIQTGVLNYLEDSRLPRLTDYIVVSRASLLWVYKTFI